MHPRRFFLLSFFVWFVLCTQGKAGFSLVVLDAGHGGHDRGGIPGQRISEKEINLDVTRRIASILRSQGLKTIMTRTDDSFIPLPTRSGIANGCRDAVFVSIHLNSSPRAGASGFETYYYRNTAASLAAGIHGKVARLGEGENRGIKRRAFFVLRKTNIPAVLCEPGFLTNPGYGKVVSNSYHRQRLALAIASGIINSSRN